MYKRISGQFDYLYISYIQFSLFSYLFPVSHPFCFQKQNLIVYTFRWYHFFRRYIPQKSFLSYIALPVKKRYYTYGDWLHYQIPQRRN